MGREGDVFTFVMLICLIICAVFTLNYSLGDYRHFQTVRKQCEEKGYIRDYDWKIRCSVEKIE